MSLPPWNWKRATITLYSRPLMEPTENPLAPTVARRSFLRLTAALGAGALLSGRQWSLAAAPTIPLQQIARFPEKTDLILLTERPPPLETPIKYFRQDLTPNDAFFVRWHMSGIPTVVNPKTFRLSLAGHVNQPLSLSLQALRTQYEHVSLIAVAQCSGTSRG